MKNFKLLSVIITLGIFLTSCSNDDEPIPNPVNPTPIIIPIDYHKKQNDITDTIRFVMNGSFEYLSEIKQNNNNFTDFFYLTQARLSKTSSWNLDDGKHVKKELIYNNNIGQVAKIINIVTSYYDLIGTEIILTSKTNEILNYNTSGNIITLQKQNIDITNNSIIDIKTYEITLTFQDINGFVYKNIESIKDFTNNTIITYSYDNKFNIYSKTYSINDLSLCYWEDLRYSRNNIKSITTKDLNTNNILNNKNYDITYIGEFCKTRYLNSILVDEYFYKNN